MTLKKGDTVKVISNNYFHRNKIGTIIHITRHVGHPFLSAKNFNPPLQYLVDMNGIQEYFIEKELKKI